MPLDVFVPPGRLMAGVSADITPRVNSAQFGDGYSQRSSDGLNAENQTFSGQFPSLSPDNSKTVRDFFSAHKVTPFAYALQLDTVYRKWIASKWSRTFVATNREAVSFTLTEVFDLGEIDIVPPPVDGAALIFSDPANSGYIALLEDL